MNFISGPMKGHSEQEKLIPWNFKIFRQIMQLQKKWQGERENERKEEEEAVKNLSRDCSVCHLERNIFQYALCTLTNIIINIHQM